MYFGSAKLQSNYIYQYWYSGVKVQYLHPKCNGMDVLKRHTLQFYGYWSEIHLLSSDNSAQETHSVGHTYKLHNQHKPIRAHQQSRQ